MSKEVCSPDCWKVSLVLPVFKNVGETPTAKNYCLVTLLSVESFFTRFLTGVELLEL